MKKLKAYKPAIVAVLLVLNAAAFAQNFTWKKGASAADLVGTYGTLGTPAAANTPGARESSVSWTDAQGNLWLFGGYGYDQSSGANYLNDLWKYNVATNQWTWMSGSNGSNQLGVYGTQGVAAAANIPGARSSGSSFIDAAGNLWLFGGYGYDMSGSYGELNDLWVYNVTSGQWKWVKGSSLCFQTGTYGTMGVAAAANTPGARRIFSSWKDAAGDFWIFGGLGYNATASGDLNDLWNYKVSSNQWTWVGGSNQLNQFGTYGTQGTAAAANIPGGRSSSSSWTDNAGNLWMLGGYGFATSGPANLLSDLWKYNITSGQWAWYKGTNNTTVQQGTYGALNTYAAANMPGARYTANTWVDGSGDLWLMGGYGFATGNTPDYLNDLWRYNVASNQWQWVKGANSIAQAGNYGVQGITSPLNMPGARGASAFWKDGSNNLWLMGGIGFDAGGSAGRLNDLWKYDNCIGPYVSIASSNASVCAGVPAVLTASGASTYTWSGSQTTSTLSIAPQGTSSYTVYGTDANGCKDTAYFTETIYNLPTISATTSKTMTCPGEPVLLSATGATTYSWSSAQPGGTISISPTVTTVYTVTGTDNNGCFSTASVTQSVSACAGIAGNVYTAPVISLYPNPAKGEFTIYTGSSESMQLIILNTTGQKVFEQLIAAPESAVKTELAKGVYFYGLFKGGKPAGNGRLMID